MPADQPADTPRPLPDALRRLSSHALDLLWAWNHAGDALWKRLDETLWERTQNPWLLLQYVEEERLEQLAADPAFLRALHALEDSSARYRHTPSWRPEGTTRLPRVAYFSMEFGLHEALPLYAGGLGVLAGDHLKTASDLDVPVVGVGILWQQGYFRQVLDPAGMQAELYPYNDPASLPIQPVRANDGKRIRVVLNLPGREILLRAWQVKVGRTMLYLLDSNDPLNAPPDRGLTSTLYSGGTEARLMQSIVLGVGGWRLLEAVDHQTDVCHLNEGHAALVVLERARAFMQQQGITFHEALWATRAANVFTTHTAVPAGFDAFSTGEVEKHRGYFDVYVRGLDLSWRELLALGRRNPDDPDEPFSMAWLALRGCSWVNGVSQLHGAVSRRLFSGLFPRWPEAEVPVAHVTNGVHVPSWDSPWTDELWTRAAGKERWRGDVSAVSGLMLEMTDEDLWSVRAHERRDLVQYVRRRLAVQFARQGRSSAAAAIAHDVLHPDALTLGIARRFATYKRPHLLLADPDRLLRLLAHPERPVQLILAGKAHPEDVEGKRLIQHWVQFAARADARRHVVFLEDYDMRMATELVQGVDVWINTPRRPWEASGTSGMKVLVNGGLNVSMLDGWWAEAFQPDCGWAIGEGETELGMDTDMRDAGRLYTLLEQEVVPEFYARDSSGLPRRWIARMRSSMALLAPRFSSVRMLQEYVEQAYLPAASRFRRRAAAGAKLAVELCRWARDLEQHWSDIHFGAVRTTEHGGRLTVSVPVMLGRIDASAVHVQLYAGQHDEDPTSVHQMVRSEPIPETPNAYLYTATIATSRPAWHFTPRVVPFHPEAIVPHETTLITWQR
jgi:glycogen phosphorylase